MKQPYNTTIYSTALYLRLSRDDELQGESELAPFLNILNEMHARQTSKKVKAAMHTRFANGAHYGAYAPIGYIKDPDKRGHLLVDEETKWIIEKIFNLAIHGAGAAKIKRLLIEERVPTPAWLNYQRNGTFAHIFEGAEESKQYMWTIAQVKSILKDENYIGNSVHNRQSNISFKNKKKVRKPPEVKKGRSDTDFYRSYQMCRLWMVACLRRKQTE